MATSKRNLEPDNKWRTKLEADHPSHGKILPIPARMRKRWGSGTILIPDPREVDTLMRKVRMGRLVTPAIMRVRLAEDAGADMTCPLTMGIFVNIVARAADEDLCHGKKRITPYWRTVKDGGKLNEKFPGGVKAQATLLRKEGFEIVPGKGKQPPRVVDFESKLARL